MEFTLDYGPGTPMNAVSKAWEINAWSSTPGFSYIHKSASATLTIEGVSGDAYLKELDNLQDNWDGYGAAKIAPEIISKARDAYAFLCRTGSAPEISPNSHGTISFEWSSARGSAQLELGIGDFSFYLTPVNGDTVYLKADFSLERQNLLSHLINNQLFSDGTSSSHVASLTFRSVGAGIM
jgi:hypothetical protein